MSDSSMDPIVKALLNLHLPSEQDEKNPIVIMTCGLAGSGKTTLAKAIQAAHPAFHRISGDEIIYRNHGLYGVDYEASSAIYEQYQAETDEIYLSTFRKLLIEKKDVILERSFYAKEDRDEYRDMANEAGAKVVLVYLKPGDEDGKEVLWRRICKRSEGPKTADSSLDITREIFEGYWNGFEAPVGEGEFVIRVV